MTALVPVAFLYSFNRSRVKPALSVLHDADGSRDAAPRSGPVPQLRWLDAATGPPPGLDLPVIPNRTYYHGFVKVYPNSSIRQ